MQNKSMLVGIALVLLAGLGFMVFSGLLRSGGQNVVEWKPDDEVTVPGDPTAEPAVGSASEGSRTAVDTPAADATPQEEANRPPVGIRGRIVAKGNTPIAGAQVVLQLNPSFRNGFGGPGGPGGRGNRGGGQGGRQQVNTPFVTGGDGRFKFTGRGYESPVVTLIVVHGQHATTVFTKEFDKAGADLDVGDVTMSVGGRIYGSITDVDSNAVPQTTATLRPAGNNRINMMRRGPGGGNRQGLPDLVPKVVVDAMGTFRVDHVAPGDYQIDATAPKKISANSETFTVADEMETQVDQIKLGPGHELRGIVLTERAEPIAEAEVSVNAMGRGRDFSTRTDKKGEFSIDHIPLEPMSLRVQAKGYITFSEPNTQIVEGQVRTINLKDGLRITGIVKDIQTGEPVTRYAARTRRVGGIPNASNPLADANPQQWAELGRRWREGSLSPDEIANLQGQGAEFLRSMQAGRRGGDGNARGGDAGGGRQGRGGGRGGNDNNGGGRGGDFVRGMRDMAANAGLTSYPTGDLGDVVDRPGGTFSFSGLDEGVYVVEVAPSDFQRVSSERVTVQFGAAAPSLTINVPRGLQLSGKVFSSADRSALPGARIELVQVLEWGNAQGAQSQRTRRGGRGMGGSNIPGGFPIAETRSAKDGSFVFKHMPAGRYELVARAEDHARKIGDQFDLNTDVSGVAIQLGALATIEGKIVDVPRGKEREVQVIVSAGFGNSKTEKASPDGTYKVTGLEPGGYNVRAFVGDFGVFMRGEMRSFRGGGEVKPDVTLEEGDVKTFNVRVTLHPVGEIVGNVMKNGLPAKGLRVSLMALDNQSNNGGQDGTETGQGGGQRGGGPGGGPGGGRRGGGPGGGPGMWGGGGAVQPTQTDPNGEFRFTDVPEGAYIVRVTTNGGGQGQELTRGEVRVRAEDTQRVPLSFQTGAIAGRVTAEGAKPEELEGSILLHPGLKPSPDQTQLPRDPSTLRMQVKAGTFSLPELPTGQYLLELRMRNREDVRQDIFVPVGDALNLEIAAGKPRAANAPNTGNNGTRGGQNGRRGQGQQPQQQPPGK